MKQKTFSLSELESYLLCPFRYFATSVLGVKPPLSIDPQLGPAEIGSLLHRILQRLLRGKEPSISQARKIVALEMESLLKHRAGLIPILLEQQRETIMKTLAAFVENQKKTRLTPKYFEWSFSSLKIPLQDDDILITGRIDRIDVDPEKKNFLVIDYKTGSQKISGNRIRRGEALQIPLYILAVQQLLPDYQPIGGLYYHLSDLSLDNGILHGERIPEGLEISPRSSTIVPPEKWEPIFQRTTEKVREIVTSIQNEEFQSREEPCEPWCPFKEVCRIRSAASAS